MHFEAPLLDNPLSQTGGAFLHRAAAPMPCSRRWTMDPTSIYRKDRWLAERQAELCQAEPEMMAKLSWGTRLGVLAEQVYKTEDPPVGAARNLKAPDSCPPGLRSGSCHPSPLQDRRQRLGPETSDKNFGTTVKRSMHCTPDHPNCSEGGRNCCLDPRIARQSSPAGAPHRQSGSRITMKAPAHPKPTKDKTCQGLILITTLALLALDARVAGSPHIPKKLTWQVFSQLGDMV
ncbi:uncharacterized protein LOC119818030 [Arvicola amphibius]|uniref:uncharacterized protein LOC119818030 n=1 Tax=Arvicola amphibius TaxID=1047088 RepID=UPI0018E2ACDF|nr:uncharacterized protein LOC119818030 [Arvicola amphibius]